MINSKESMAHSSKEKTNFIIVAHPDDETIFFGGLILSRPEDAWKVVCVTDGNADGQGAKRAKQFADACRSLGVNEFEMWGLPDIYEKRLDHESLVKKLGAIQEDIGEVFTHGPLGEYGHPHHQDVSFAVHKFFAGKQKVFCPAYNFYPEIRVPLSKSDYDKKFKILSGTYKSEIERFIHLLPATWEEGFTQVSVTEVESVYKYVSGASKEKPKKLQKLKHLSPFIEPTGPRPF